MIPIKPAPDLIRGGCRFSDKIMLLQESMIPKKPAPDLIRVDTGFRTRSCSTRQLRHQLRRWTMFPLRLKRNMV